MTGTANRFLEKPKQNGCRGLRNADLRLQEKLLRRRTGSGQPMADSSSATLRPATDPRVVAGRRRAPQGSGSRGTRSPNLLGLLERRGSAEMFLKGSSILQPGTTELGAAMIPSVWGERIPRIHPPTAILRRREDLPLDWVESTLRILRPLHSQQRSSRWIGKSTVLSFGSRLPEFMKRKWAFGYPYPCLLYTSDAADE